uniref:Uncharacterized protein n=1 Tax=Cannabis sativa TaxID=3483 RepID=A0A803Q5N1_CANSA
MTLSPWDLPLLADQNRYSNFESFLQSVTPIIPSKRIPKSHAEDFVECFSLNSLWKFFTERSIYGVGVPILLNNGDSVLQYYCPSLSALQIYVENPFVSPRIGGNINSWSDESENDELLSQSLSNNSSKSSDNTSDGSNTDHEVSSQQVDRFGDLYFQFNETSSPYDRVPLTEKINELAQNYPDLLKFQSTDLSPYSWIAIACAIRPFAAAMYKMNGELWMNPEAADQAKIGSYLDAATSWLKLLSFQHHDFNFFMSRRCF